MTKSMGMAALFIGITILSGRGDVPAWAEVERTSVRPATLSHAFASADALINEFLRALEKDDPDALRRLRVTETEYREIILPGSVREGQPLRQYRKDVADYAWSSLDTRSWYHEQALLQGYRGRRLTMKSVEYDKGVGRYANHTAYKQLRLTLDEPATGKEVKLGTGSIVEIDGRFKFISFIND
jgi:hypothetical protein